MNGKTNLLSFKPNMSGEVIKSIYSLGNNRGSSSYTITVKILEMFSGCLFTIFDRSHQSFSDHLFLPRCIKIGNVSLQEG